MFDPELKPLSLYFSFNDDYINAMMVISGGVWIRKGQ